MDGTAGFSLDRFRVRAFAAMVSLSGCVSVCSFVSALRGRIVGDLVRELVISGSVEVSFVKKSWMGLWEWMNNAALRFRDLLLQFLLSVISDLIPLCCACGPKSNCTNS